MVAELVFTVTVRGSIVGVKAVLDVDARERLDDLTGVASFDDLTGVTSFDRRSSTTSLESLRSTCADYYDAHW